MPLPAPPRRAVPPAHLAAVLAAVLAALLTAACGGDAPTRAGGGGEPIVAPPAVLPVVGQGPVAARFTSELSVHGGYAYTGTWGRRGAALGSVLYVWDVSGAAPVLRDSVQVDPNPASPTVGTLGDVQVTDDGALLVVATEPAGSLVTYALDDPARPRLVSRFTTPDLAAGVHTAQVSRVNGTLYAFCALDPRASVPAKLAVVDLSNPAAPRQVFARAMGSPFVHDTYVRDGWLVTANWDAGVTVWDVGARGRGTPAAPDSVGAVRTAGGQAHNVWWGRLADGSARWMVVGEEGPGAVGSASSGDVHVVDMADPARPREVAVYQAAGAGTHNFAVDTARAVLYAAYYNGGVRALDLRGDLGACSAAQRTADGRCDLARAGRELARGLDGRGAYVWGVEFLAGGASPGAPAGDRLYASDMLGGLWRLAPLAR